MYFVANLLVIGPTNGLVMSCRIALDANIRPTIMFSFRMSRCLSSIEVLSLLPAVVSGVVSSSP